MMPAAGPESLVFNLEFLPEPAMIVDMRGVVRSANSAARGLLRLSGEGTENLLEIVQDDRGDVVAYLQRASRSTSSHVGSLTLARNDGAERFRALAARMQPATGDVLLIVRLMPARDDQFSVLNRRLREMDRQLHQRLKENAMLQEALAENRVLLRELQHRVKNNIQQMLSLIKMSAGRHRSPEVAEVVDTASHRLHAMATTQEALYQSAGAGSISARSFLEDVVRGAASSYGASGQLIVSIADGQMTSEEAHCLALVTNELVTNAFKHGLAHAAGKVSVRFSSSPDGLCLEVHDDGPGFEDGTNSRASGLKLVRSLCRQIGAKLEIASDGGARCSLHFRSALATRPDPGAAREQS